MGSAAVERALGLDAVFTEEGFGYGEPIPYKGMSRFDPLLTLYWGMSLGIKSSGAWRVFEACLGAAVALFAEEERGREVIVLCAFSACKRSGFDVCDGASWPRVVETRQRRVLGLAHRHALLQTGIRDVPVQQRSRSGKG